MSYPRLIPCILLKSGLIVRSQSFKYHQIIGNPINTIRRLSNWGADEIILLDISDGDHHDLRRDDEFERYDGSSVLELLRQIADVCLAPLSLGGRIKTLEDISQRLSSGADKCVINTQALENPAFITEAAEKFGSQCITISIDAIRHNNGQLEVFSRGGSHPTGLTPEDWAREVEDRGAGEILLNSIDRDGTGIGYDIELIKSVTGAVKLIPVIACGGVGSFEHFSEGITAGGASAISAANIFHFRELSYPLAKKACMNSGISMRKIELETSWMPRQPVYDFDKETSRLNKRLTQAGNPHEDKTGKVSRKSIRWCLKCVYPSSSATLAEFDDDQICMGCSAAGQKVLLTQQDWDFRKQRLVDLIEQTRCPDGSRHDCIIPVSGGKDSYFQTHFVKNVLGFNPLLVTYYGNNYSEVGETNLRRMKEAFDVDHIIYQPGVETLKKLNRLGFTIMGDMNWHGHMGIISVPMRMAVEKKIPIVVWGENTWSDLSGQNGINDYCERNYRHYLEHDLRGFHWSYMIGREGLTAHDLIAYHYPTDNEMFDVGLRGIHMGDYVYWEANDHIKLVVEKYGFKISDEPFDRTYRMMSNLDDIHENGVHDYMKWIKFGYGRCTDHASKDIRSGKITRDKGIELVRKYDHVKPRDLERWLDYIGMTEEKFDGIADTFRNTRVWWKENGVWVKDNIWEDDKK